MFHVEHSAGPAGGPAARSGWEIFEEASFGMSTETTRREFIKLATAAAIAPSFAPSLARAAGTTREAGAGGAGGGGPGDAIEAFDYCGVRLLDGPMKRRYEATRDFYLAIPDDDILKGFRREAGLAAPGEDLGGWREKSSAGVFGQWLSGMARIYRATGDEPMRRKAVGLAEAWGETMPKLGYRHYDYDKYVCGLVDLAEYAGWDGAVPLLARLTDLASEKLGRDRLPATDADSQGGFFNGQLEWYTLGENLYRAFQLTGDQRYRDFAGVWSYPHYWGMFDPGVTPTPYGFHGYSHLNALSSAAMAYAVTGERKYLAEIVNGHDWFVRTQCYATGGYGPGEKLMRPDGALGESVASEPNEKFLGGAHGRSFETPCGTWAVFKLCRYLQRFTGEARFGDWAERVLYNGIAAALPMAGRGRTFYYADYRLGGGEKHYFGDAWPCCSGTFIQDVADYPNLLYYKDSAGLLVNLFAPSEVTWDQAGESVTVEQRTSYPESDVVAFGVRCARPVAFDLRFRVPAWAEGVTAAVNAGPVDVKAEPGRWASVRRTWSNGDDLTLRIASRPRFEPIDAQHPRRVAMSCGPVAMVRTGAADAPLGRAEDWTPVPDHPLELSAGEGAGRFVPFYAAKEGEPYRMYHDLKG